MAITNVGSVFQLAGANTTPTTFVGGGQVFRVGVGTPGVDWIVDWGVGTSTGAPNFDTLTYEQRTTFSHISGANSVPAVGATTSHHTVNGVTTELPFDDIDSGLAGLANWGNGGYAALINWNNGGSADTKLNFVDSRGNIVASVDLNGLSGNLAVGTSVVLLDNGNYLVTWNDVPVTVSGIVQSDVNATLISATGTIISTTTVNTTNNDTQLSFPGQTVQLGDGSLVTLIVSTDLNSASPATFTDLLIRRLDANGAPIGPEINVTNAAPGIDIDFDFTKVVDTGDGGFAVIWYEQERADVGDPFFWNVISQKFNADGTMNGTSVVVASDTATLGGAPSGVAVEDIQVVQLANGGWATVIETQDLATSASTTTAYKNTHNGGGIPGADVLTIPGPFTFGLSDLELAADGRVLAVGGGAGITTTSGILGQYLDFQANSINGDGTGETLYGRRDIHDTIFGNGGNDTLNGLSGDDFLRGGLGDDTINGGAGFDTADYSTATGSVTVDLGAGTATGADGTDTLSSIENVRGGNSVDTLTGNAENNQLRGNGGADILDGGAGEDWADYANAVTAVTVTLTDVADGLGRLQGSATGGAGNDQLFSIERIRGGNGDDVLTGNGLTNWLRGNGGDDTLNGGAGNDWADYFSATGSVTVDLAAGTATGAGTDTLISIERVRGGGFNDTISGNGDANFIRGGLGNDTLDGAGGNDWADYFDATGSVTASLATGTSSGAEGNDTLANFENIRGGSFNDMLTGDAGVNHLRGGMGTDALDGGAGLDYASYQDATTAIIASLTNATLNTGEAAGDTYVNIEGLVGGAFNDTLTGDSGDNRLDGGGGGDVLNGGSGFDFARYRSAAAGVTASLLAPATNTGDAAGDSYVAIEGLQGSNFDDTLTGNASNNTIVGGSGADAMDGGGGTDTASYDLVDVLTGVTASLTSPGGNTGDAAGDTYTSIENLTGTLFNDVLSGDGGVNTLRGLGGDDTLDGGNGDDYLWGGANGTNGDTASFASAGGSVTVTMYDAATSTSLSGFATGAAGTDRLYEIEHIEGSDFDDTITGNSGANFLSGRAGTDTISGGAGDDTIEGGSQDDTLFGGAGIDTISGGTENDTIDGGADNDILDGDNGNDTLIGGTGNDVMTGGQGNDTYYVDSLLDTINETDGNGFDTLHLALNMNLAAGVSIDHIIADFTTAANIAGNELDNRITGNIADDSLFGNAGTDHLEGLEGDDFLRGGTGNDTIDGGLGSDIADYSTASGSVTVSLAAGTATGADGSDTLISIEQVRGSDSADSLTGDAFNNVLRGNLGDDTINGEAGEDWADYSNATAQVVVNLAAGTASGAHGNDTLVSIERVRGGSAGDILTGDAQNNFLRGNGGDDTLDGGAGTDWADYFNASGAVTVSLSATGTASGAAGNDTLTNMENIRGGASNDVLTGNDGNNIIRGGAGADTIVGGLGMDLADYREQLSAIVVNLTNPAVNTGEAAGDTFSGIEGLIGTAFNDTLTGDGGDNRLEGGAGADLLNGGGGFDNARYRTATAGVTASLIAPATNTGDAAGDTYVSIEGLQGSDFNDVLTGNALNNTLMGAAGADALNGGDGNDTAAYNFDDVTQGVYANLTSPGGNTGDAAGDTYVSIENLTGTKFGDTLIGNGVANTLKGLEGDDVFIGGLGDDRFEGGFGIDKVSYELASGAVVVELFDTVLPSDLGGSTTGADGTDRLYDIENVTGSDFDDRIYGNSSANVLIGGNGADRIYAGAGVDTLTGGAGDDILDGQGGADAMDGGADSDRYYVDNILDTVADSSGTADIVYTTADWTLAAGVDIEYIYVTSTTGKTVNGNELDNRIDGNTGNDTLNGGGGIDTLLGKGGNDIIDGGTGDDRLTGGDGDDTYYVDSYYDLITEYSGEGTDTVYASASFRLRDHVDNLVLTGTSALFGIGSDQANDITGNSANNVILGEDGNDRISGGGGIDTLFGDGGDDTFVILNTYADRDAIRDFNFFGDDTLEIGAALFGGGLTAGALAANQFLASSSAVATTADQRFLYDTDSGYLFFDADGNGAGARELVSILVYAPTIDHTDFLIV